MGKLSSAIYVPTFKINIMYRVYIFMKRRRRSSLMNMLVPYKCLGCIILYSTVALLTVHDV